MSRENRNIENPKIRKTIGQIEKESDMALFFAKIILIAFFIITLLVFVAIGRVFIVK